MKLPGMNKAVHFILLGGELTPEYRRAIKSAAVHEAPINLWCTGSTPDTTGLNVKVRHTVRPPEAKGRETAHAWDVLAYQIGYYHGGLVIGLDTISLRPAWDLLGDADVVVSTDWPDADLSERPDPYNNNFLARPLTGAALALRMEASRRFKYDQETWGYTGPKMLTSFVDEGIIRAAPYPALCGWAPGYIWKFYLGLERPPADARIIHLCATGYADLYHRRYEAWAEKYPYYAGEVARRTDLNADLLKLD
jgi:hypothetical protein